MTARPGAARTRLLARIAAISVLTMPVSSLHAAPGDLASAPPGASSCSGCHAAHASAGTSVPAIQGRPAAEIVAALDAFRTGARPATMMNRIATGFSQDESRAIATWISAQPVPR